MKPKWAMTEKQSEEMDEEQTLELLDFADNLNFDESNLQNNPKQFQISAKWTILKL